MTGNQASSREPVASFVIEREAGRGYRVTAANGDCPEERKTRALKLLDEIGQPDPKGPNEFLRVLGPIAPAGEYIFVSINLMPNGEARYHQGWFRLLTPANGSRFPISAFLLVLVAGLAIGTLAGPTLFTPNRPTPLEPVSDPGLERLNTQLRSSRDVRARVEEYLSQEGLAATSVPVSDQKRSVKLIADLDKTPPPQESIRLNNVEVAKLLGILRRLDDLHEHATSTRGKPDQ